MADEPNGKNVITVRSMFGYRTRDPLVSLRLKDVACQLHPDEAREIGQYLIAAAEAAECDAAVMRMAMDGLGLDEAEGAKMLSLFRRYREEGGRQ